MADTPAVPTGQNPQTGEIPGKQGPVQGTTAGPAGATPRPNPQAPNPQPAQPFKTGASFPTGAEPDKPKAAFEFIGGPGTPFNINGKGFGEQVGQLSIGGYAVAPTRWNDTSIKGMVPGNLPPGPTEVVVNGKRVTVNL